MKLVQLDYNQLCTREFLVVVEVPDDYPEENVASLLSDKHLAEPASEGEVHSSGESPCIGVSEISASDGSAHYKLLDGQLVKARAGGTP
jgi:hypothetical protein